MEKEKDYYDVEEASELCYTTKQTIYNYIKELENENNYYVKKINGKKHIHKTAINIIQKKLNKEPIEKKDVIEIEIKKEIENLNNTINLLKTSITDKNNIIDFLQNQITEKDKQIQSLNERIRENNILLANQTITTKKSFSQKLIALFKTKKEEDN